VTHPEAAALVARAHYPPLNRELLAAQLHWLRRAPRRYARAWRHALAGNARSPASSCARWWSSPRRRGSRARCSAWTSATSTPTTRPTQRSPPMSCTCSRGCRTASRSTRTTSTSSGRCSRRRFGRSAHRGDLRVQPRSAHAPVRRRRPRQDTGRPYRCGPRRLRARAVESRVRARGPDAPVDRGVRGVAAGLQGPSLPHRRVCPIGRGGRRPALRLRG
jgi:hypothetical protein